MGTLSVADKEKILASVDQLQEQMITAVQDLVRIKSISAEFHWEDPESQGGEGAVSRYLAKLWEKEDVLCELFAKAPGRENLCVRCKGTGQGKSLLFNGHVDVVPPGDLEEWQGIDPFGGVCDGQYLYGRGAADMKGGNVAAAFALKALLQAGFRPKGDVILQHAVGEECKANDFGTTACLEQGYTADAAVVCEPTCDAQGRFQINIAAFGVSEVKWRVKGKSCHTGRRREVVRDGGLGMAVGVDAIEKGMIVYQAVKELERQWGQSKSHELYPPGQFCINGATVKGGVGPSLIAPDMEMGYAITYSPYDQYAQVQKEFTECIQNACLNDPWLRQNPPEIEWVFDWPPFNTPKDAPIAQLAQAVAAEVVPGSGDLTGMNAVCDAPFLWEKGIPSIVLGPGNIQCAHTTEVKLAIKELVEAAKIYALLIAQWCGIE